MGLGASVVAIPDALLPRVAEILRSAMIRVEDLPLDPRDDPQHFLKSLRCAQHGGVVRISIQREPHVNASGPILVIVPSRDGDREQNKFLVRSIEDALQRNGAWIPTPAAT